MVVTVFSLSATLNPKPNQLPCLFGKGGITLQSLNPICTTVNFLRGLYGVEGLGSKFLKGALIGGIYREYCRGY